MKRRHLLLALSLVLFGNLKLNAVDAWLQRESEHFLLIYKPAHAHFARQIINTAEASLRRLANILGRSPGERIVITTFDFSDYGSAAATTVPHNFIRLEIEPMERDYENVPFRDRIQWLISHELVHIIVNDQAGVSQRLRRTLFGKVPPEKMQPATIFYSLLTNPHRFTPRWHQEAIAVFFETWLNGGYGRMLGNFDEMYFRSVVLEEAEFPSFSALETKVRDESFLLDLLHYLYGARFASYLVVNHGSEKLLDWYRGVESGLMSGYEAQFRKVYGFTLEEGWQRFAVAESAFQNRNLRALRAVSLTPVTRLQKKPAGWVTQAYYDPNQVSLFYALHRPHELAGIVKLSLSDRHARKIGSMPTPRLVQMASTAYDPSTNLLFFTTNNNKLYRDIWVFDTTTRTQKLLLENHRIGNLTVDAKTGEVWGVRHSAGLATLVSSKPPYQEITGHFDFKPSDDLYNLAISPSGRYLAANLSRASGRQAIIVADIDYMKRCQKFTYQVVSTDGSPEFPSWSPDERHLLWSAYTNGVSNIYRYDRESGKTEAMSHTLRGLFRPVYVSTDSLFAFEFTSEGFVPALIPNRPAQGLPAIQYYGQQMVKREPELTRMALPRAQTVGSEFGGPYRALGHIQRHSLIPVITGFQKQKAIGVFSHWADPLFVHDFQFEVGTSFFNGNSVVPKFHFMGQYQYKRRLKLALEHNGANFYDLFNERKSGMIGTKATVGYTHFWKFDMPHKVKQTAEIAVYRGITAINDNLVKVTRPDFVVAQSALTSQNYRRSIGSTGWERGTGYSVTFMGFAVEPTAVKFAGGVHAEAEHYSTWLRPHNVLHVKTSAGWRHTRQDMAQGKFYFGGFGNRFLESKEPHQFQKTFRLPGIPIYSVSGSRFLKVMLENRTPALRFSEVGLGSHLLSHFDVSLYSQGLAIDSERSSLWLSVGGQINFVFRHWFNLDSILSFGVARASSSGGHSSAWFASIKLLR